MFAIGRDHFGGAVFNVYEFVPIGWYEWCVAQSSAYCPE